MRNEKLGKIICKRISDLMRQNNLSVEQLAYQSGISKGGLSEIVRYKKDPSNYTILNICLALNITMTEFFDFDELNNYTKEIS
ncbi:MAG: helix-turn-helix transcriptional regulator [bacterium]|nr:helix-turn-helix transcriptional regulator [bacterium]